MRLPCNIYTSEEVKLSTPLRQNPFSPFQNYPYYYIWKNIFFEPESLLDKDGFQPNCPVLFVYGCQGIKGFMSFHDRQWLEYLEQKPESKAVAFEKAGHWLMRDNPTELNQLIDDFLATDREAGSGRRIAIGRLTTKMQHCTPIYKIKVP